MIKYLQVNNKTGRTAEVYYREKPKTGAKCTTETYIKKTKSVLITGEAASGKSRNLHKVWLKRNAIWTKKPSVLINSNTPLSEWIDTNKDYLKISKGEKQYQTLKKLQDFCQAQKTIIFIENAHKLTGRKLDIARAMAYKNVVYATALSENRIPATIRQSITANCLRLRFGTKVAFDGTQALIIAVALLAFMFGMPEAGMVASVFAMLKSGKLASNDK